MLEKQKIQNIEGQESIDGVNGKLQNLQNYTRNLLNPNFLSWMRQKEVQKADPETERLVKEAQSNIYKFMDNVAPTLGAEQYGKVMTLYVQRREYDWVVPVGIIMHSYNLLEGYSDLKQLTLEFAKLDQKDIFRYADKYDKYSWAKDVYKVIIEKETSIDDLITQQLDYNFTPEEFAAHIRVLERFLSTMSVGLTKNRFLYAVKRESICDHYSQLKGIMPWLDDVILEWFKRADTSECVILLRALEEKGKIDRQGNFHKTLADIISGRPETSIVNRTQGEKNTRERLTGIGKDPALRIAKDILIDYVPDDIRSLLKTPLQQDEFRILIARNFYSRSYPVSISKEKVAEESRRIMELRKEVDSIPLFSERTNVLLLANLEEIKKQSRFGGKNKTEPRFGRPDTVDALKRQNKNTTLLRPQSNIESLKQTKQKVLDWITNTPPPFTLVFDGHGLEDGIYLSSGRLKDNTQVHVEVTRISAIELAKAYSLRKEKFPAPRSPRERDVIVFSSCLSHDLTRSIYSYIDIFNSGSPKPIIIGASEVGQNAYSNFKSKYDSDFLEKVFQLNDKKHITTLGDVVKNDPLIVDSDPFMYIPVEKEIPIEII